MPHPRRSGAGTEFFDVFGVHRRTVASFEESGMALTARDFRFPEHLQSVGL